MIGIGSNLFGVNAKAKAKAAIHYLVSDLFAGAANANLSSGGIWTIPSDGAIVYDGSGGVAATADNSNNPLPQLLPDSSFAFAVHDCSKTDVTVSLNYQYLGVGDTAVNNGVTYYQGNQCWLVILRYTDMNNFVAFFSTDNNGLSLLEVIGGGAGAYSQGNPPYYQDSQGDHFTVPNVIYNYQVNVSGSTVTTSCSTNTPTIPDPRGYPYPPASVQGGDSLTITLASQLTQTQHGFGASFANAALGKVYKPLLIH